jgi:hypothetical protein
VDGDIFGRAHSPDDVGTQAASLRLSPWHDHEIH